MSQRTVLHYVGYDDDRGGIVSVIRNLAATGQFSCVLGVNPEFRQERQPALKVLHLPRLAGERIDLANLWQARRVAREVRPWLRADSLRVFHGHSRAGLLVACWLRASGESRVVASVHCLGRQRWFYRFAARVLGDRLHWLGPAMKRHYGLADRSWRNCIPDCVPMPEEGNCRRQPGRDSCLRVGCVGALVAVKEWEVALQALARLPADLPATLVHVGSTDGSVASAAYADRLRRQSERLHIADRIEWRGQLENLAAFHSEIDVLVVASPWEAFSVAALEAAAAGVPIVAPDRAGTADLIESAKVGRLFRTGDPDDLARVIASFASDAGRVGLDFLPAELRRFAASAVAAQWAAVYEDLADRAELKATRSADR
jgi:glycosyltransferase involved in cell wall biosynthesis